MKAAWTTAYGPADVLETRDLPIPHVGDHDVLVEVRATPVTAGDVRLRAGDFPSVSAIVGPLMLGIKKPRHAVQGTHFAGRVTAIGSKVKRYALGDDVFGFTMHGAYAEYVVLSEDASMAKMPSSLRHDEAAAIPYGALTALRILRDVVRVKRGDRVLVVGAAGGVGRFAVQIAKDMGAHVTGACRSSSFDLVRDLGADEVVEDGSNNTYDVIFDTAGVTRFSRGSLRENGRYVSLFMSVALLFQVLFTAIFGSRKAKFAIVMGTRDDMEALADLAERGVVRPIIGARFPLERIAAAHEATKTSKGCVVVTA